MTCSLNLPQSRLSSPEDCTDQELATPSPVSREGDSEHYTYLDTTGRPVIKITSEGVLAESHIQNFQLQIKFPHTKMLLEPLLLVFAFFLFFLLTGENIVELTTFLNS